MNHRRYPYASSISSTESSQHHRHKLVPARQCPKPSQPQQLQEPDDEADEIEVTFREQHYRLTGLDSAATCQDLIFALLWFRERRRRRRHGGGSGSGTDLPAEPEHGGSGWLAAEAARYEMVADFPGRVKRIRGHLPVRRLLRCLRRRSQRQQQPQQPTQPFRLRVRRRRRHRRQVTFVCQDEEEAEETAAATAAAAAFAVAGSADNATTGDEELLIRDWMLRLNLIRRHHQRRHSSPSPSASELEVRRHVTRTTRTTATATTTTTTTTDCGDSDTGVSSMAQSEPDHQLQRLHSTTRLHPWHALATVPYRTECLADCDSPDTVYFATLV